MGFLSALFKKDWPAELAKAEAALEDGDTVQAYDLARKVVKGAEGELQGRAESLLVRVREEWIRSALEKAKRAEEEGDLADAADWIKSAMEKCEDDAQLSAMEARRRGLLDRVLDAATPFVHLAETVEDPTEPEPMDVDFLFEMLTNTLTESVRTRFHEIDEPFREAVVHLNEGRAEDALDALDTLLDKSPEEGILLLERGRALLLLHRTEEARSAFEAAWDDVGEEPLDEGGALSLPGLWAEATLAEGDHLAVVERLEDLASPSRGRTDLFQLYAGTLVAAQGKEAAEPYIREALRYLPGQSDLVLLMAGILASTDRLDEAITGLEASIAPSCASGSCGRKGKHLPSFRLLAELHLEKGEDIGRCRELMAMVAHQQGGVMGARDHGIMARYYETAGDLKAAEHCREEAERLSGRVEAEAMDVPTGGQRAVL